MASHKENKDFLNDTFGNALDDSIQWISSNMEPQEVFSLYSLDEWAQANGYKKTEEE